MVDMVVVVTISVRRMVGMRMGMYMFVCMFVSMLMMVMGIHDFVHGMLSQDFDVGARNSAAINMTDAQLRPDVERC